MKVLVTGGTGFIGSKTVRKLRSKGHKVKLFKGDVRKIEDWKKNLVESPDVVFHLAAIRTETPKDFGVNTNGTENLFKALQKLKIKPKKVVFASSQAVYIGLKPPFKETDKPTPRTIYGKSKFEAEKVVLPWGKKLNIPVVILRYSTVLGPGIRDKSNMSGPLYEWVSKALARESIEVFGDGRQTRDYIHIDDVVDANLLVAELEISGIFNVGGGREIKLIDLANWVRETASNASEVLIVGGKLSSNDPRHLFSDISKLKKLGWSSKGEIRRAVQELAFGLKGKIK